MSSPYAPPKSQIVEPAATDESVEKVRTGQRLIIWSILLYFGLGAISVFAGQNPSPLVGALLGLFVLVGIVAMFVMSIMGLFRIWSGLRTSVPIRILLLFLLLIPLVGLLTLVAINGRATKFLRAHGYRVGFLGASARA